MVFTSLIIREVLEKQLLIFKPFVIYFVVRN